MTNDLPLVNPSIIGRLLQELSWSGTSVSAYRDGGLGNENVLTAEVLQGLDLLPRTRFFGAVIAAAHDAPVARARLIEEAEDAEFTLLPGDVSFGLGDANEERIAVQPDGLIVSPSCHVMLEAKRLRRGSFQAGQLAREFLLTVVLAEQKTPLLFLILPTAPPVPVQGCGRMDIKNAIAARLDSVLPRCGFSPEESESRLAMVPDTVAWTTWHELSAVVEAQFSALPPDVEPSLRASIERLAASVTQAVDRHA